MRHRASVPGYLVTAIVAVVLSWPVAVLGQTSAAPTKAPDRATSAPTLPPPPPRLPWGDPNLQGVWTRIHFNRTVPFERPREIGERSELTEEEFQARLTANIEAVEADPLAGGIGWADEISPYVTPSRQSSVVVDPPDGRIPPLTPEAERRLAALEEAARQRLARGEIGPETFRLQERCVTRGFPNVMNPAPASSTGMQIVQGPGYLAIRVELQNEYRVIPLQPRPSLGPKLRQWWGESRGRWEGDTLVVETANFNNRPKVDWFEPTGEELRIVERFRRGSYGVLDYQYTVVDPATFTRPWTAKASWGLNESQPEIMEYACHAGNYDMPVMIRSAVMEAEKKAKGDATSGKP
jgi:hypothetical protein